MSRIKLFILSLTLVATLASGFMYFFLSDVNVHGLTDNIHQKSSKELMSQQFFMEESEIELDEKSNEFIRPLFFVVSFFTLAFLLIFVIKLSLIFRSLVGSFRPNILVPIYLSNQVFRN